MLSLRYFSYLLFDPFFYLFPRLRSLVPVLRRQTHIPKKRHMWQPNKGILPLPPVFTFWDIPFPCCETLGWVSANSRPDWEPRTTILDKINENPRPPLPPKSRMGNGAFLPFARLHPWFGGDGGLLFHFILSKIVSCQSCLVPQLVPRPHYYSAQPERLGSRGPNEDPGKTPYTWYKPRTSKHGGEVGGWKRFRIFYRGFCTDSSLPFKRETYN